MSVNFNNAKISLPPKSISVLCLNVNKAKLRENLIQSEFEKTGINYWYLMELYANSHFIQVNIINLILYFK